MKAIRDERKIKIYVIEIVNGTPSKSHVADAWQDRMGRVVLSGLWSGVVPASLEDNSILASDSEVSPLEMFYRRLFNSPLIDMEIE